MIFFRYYWLLLPQILVHQIRINGRNSMLTHLVFHNIAIHWYEEVGGERNSEYYMLSLYDVKSLIKIKEVTRGIVDNFVSIFVTLKVVCYLKQRRKIYHALYVISPTILVCYFGKFLFVNEGNFTTFYVSSSYFSTTLQYTDTKD